LDVANEIEKPYFRSYALSEVAKQLSHAGFRIKASRVLKQAETVAEKIPERDLQLQSLQNVRSLMDKLSPEKG
jgi:hypothetical protein